MTTPPNTLIIARIVAAFGIKGEVKAAILTDFPDRLAKRATVLLGRENETPRSFTIRGVRMHQGAALITFAGCDDRNTAESLRGMLVQIAESDVAPLPDGAYYFHQIIGLSVWGTDGLLYGTITSIMTTASNDVYMIDGDRGRLMVPAIPDFVRQVDIESGRIIVDMANLL